MRPYAPEARNPARRGEWPVLLCLLGALGTLAALPSTARGQSLQDAFNNRVSVNTFTGQIVQDNSTATVEIDEPKHGGKTGGHSV